MSFCVNCGVKLKQSEKVCPLCNTKVINSNNLECSDKPVYSILNDEYNKINHKFVCELITIIFFCSYSLAESQTSPAMRSKC